MSALAVSLLAVVLGLVGYCYVGYPALLAALGRVRPRPPGWKPGGVISVATSRGCPFSCTFCAVPGMYGHAFRTHSVDRVLEADYPAERRHILVVSDASTDRTADIVGEYAGRGVELLRLERRGGKSAAENAARSHLVGDIVVSADASVRVHPQALKLLVASFADRSVGVASGRDVSVARHAKLTSSDRS